MTLGKRIKKERSKLRLTQAAFGLSVGVSRNQVWKWEVDRDKPSFDNLKKIAVGLGKDIAWLLREGEQSTISQPRPSDRGRPASHNSVIPYGFREFQFQDLSGEKLLETLPRMTFRRRSVPAIGGIPILAALGQGGMSAVYLGYHPRLGLEVAIKVLPLPGRPELAERFRHEAQLAAKVKSRHLVGVLDVNEELGICYQILEFVRGKSAGAYLRDARQAGSAGLDEATALEICIAAAKGLAALHLAGIVHRDVKPDNILIPEGPREGLLQFNHAKLADLGLAQHEDRSALAAAGAFVGTPAFAAPEQVLDARTVGKPADVFSMGATLYALLSGRPPFADASPSRIMLNVVQRPHLPVTQARADVSAATAALIDVFCLDKVPEKRCADAAVLLNELQLCKAALPHPPAVPPPAMADVEQVAENPAGQPTREHPGPPIVVPAPSEEEGARLPFAPTPSSGDGGAKAPKVVVAEARARGLEASPVPGAGEAGELFRLALREAEKYKWAESEKAGRNLGGAALQDWFWRHGWRWCRRRWVEHLRGEHYWGELDAQNFGSFPQAESGITLLAEILGRIETGAENMEVIDWAQRNGRDMDRVLETLAQLDRHWHPAMRLLAAWNAAVAARCR